MVHKLSEHLHNLGKRLHSFSLGTTIALFAVLVGQIGQTCAITGQ